MNVVGAQGAVFLALVTSYVLKIYIVGHGHVGPGMCSGHGVTVLDGDDLAAAEFTVLGISFSHVPSLLQTPRPTPGCAGSAWSRPSGHER